MTRTWRGACGATGIGRPGDAPPLRPLGRTAPAACVGKAAAAIGPELLLLDEPTKGLDLESRRIIARALRDHVKAGGTVIMATHDLDFAEQVADDVAMMFDGEIACMEPRPNSLPTTCSIERDGMTDCRFSRLLAKLEVPLLLAVPAVMAAALLSGVGQAALAMLVVVALVLALFFCGLRGISSGFAPDYAHAGAGGAGGGGAHPVWAHSRL